MVLASLPEPTECLHPGPAVDSGHPTIVERARSLIDPSDDEVANAVRLYYWTRDQIRYNPYALDISIEGLRASTSLAQGQAWCVPKAILLAALCRAAGIPARLGYADVRNHLSTARMRQAMRTDVFYFHGYTSIYLKKRWVKATPAFNIELCEKFGLKPLEFNGLEDSLYHAFDLAGNRHMEYLNDRGEYLEPPVEEMLRLFREHYPGMMADQAGDGDNALGQANWEEDVNREVGLS